MKSKLLEVVFLTIVSTSFVLMTFVSSFLEIFPKGDGNCTFGGYFSTNRLQTSNSDDFWGRFLKTPPKVIKIELLGAGFQQLSLNYNN